MKTSVTPLAEIAGDGTTVAISHVETPKGERLELATQNRDEQVRFDALLLEWVTGQDEATFRRLLDTAGGTASPEGERIVASNEITVVTSEALATITNEFAHVDVSRVTTPEGEHLALAAPKLGIDRYLNGRALEILTYPSMETFSDLLREHTE
jgi:hypothetical protein